MNGKLLHNEILLHINQTSKHLKQHQDTLPMLLEEAQQPRENNLLTPVRVTSDVTESFILSLHL